MFTGIVESVGKVAGIVESAQGAYRLEIQTPLASQIKKGDSIATNGVCLTVVSQAFASLGFDLLAETVTRSNLGNLKVGDKVNLERSMAALSRFDGHIVQGHIDTTARLLAVEAVGQDHRIEIELPEHFQKYVVFKGSIAVNGISLTVAELKSDRFTNWIIPFTWDHTNLHCLQAGDRINLEFDLVAKYIERLVGIRAQKGGRKIEQKELKGLNRRNQS